MITFIAWGAAALSASSVLTLFVLAIRAHVRGWFGPQIGYGLWAIPALRLCVPALPTGLLSAMPFGERATAGVPLAIGPLGALQAAHGVASWAAGDALMALWLTGAIGLFAVASARHFRFCHQTRSQCRPFGSIGSIRVIIGDVPGPLAFGVIRRFIAVPSAFSRDYSANERELALAHESAHHARGDLIANWVSLIVLAVHWWNPIAWIAIRAFREDQEFAADAHVLAVRTPDALPQYAQVLAKAAGIGALPACNLNARSNLKGRLMMLDQTRRSTRRLVAGGITLAVLGGTALAATATTSESVGSGKQAVTIGVKPDGSGGYALLIGNRVVPSGTRLPGGMTLPADFSGHGGCKLDAAAKPHAYVIKGMGRTRTYTVMCASAGPVPVRGTLEEGLASLNMMRASVATQPASLAFPEAERTHALGAIDHSIQEVQATIATSR